MDNLAPDWYGPRDATSTPATAQFSTMPDALNTHTGSPEMPTELPTASIATSFPPDRQVDAVLPTLVLLSSDLVHFFVHDHVLKSMSTNKFQGLLNADSTSSHDANTDSGTGRFIPIKPVSVHSDTLNAVLHAAYNTSCAQFAPTSDTLIDTVDLLPKYGISPTRCIYGPSDPSSDASPLYTLLLSLAPADPLPIYILAAHHSLDDLAVASSQYLLSTPSHAVSDKAALRMGPVYMKRFLFLLLGRVEALKTLVSAPPSPHASTLLCSAKQQNDLAQAWTLAAGYLLWDAQPDLPISSIEASLGPIGNLIHCHLCQRSLGDRIHEVITQWPKVKRTI